MLSVEGAKFIIFYDFLQFNRFFPKILVIVVLGAILSHRRLFGSDCLGKVRSEVVSRYDTKLSLNCPRFCQANEAEKALWIPKSQV